MSQNEPKRETLRRLRPIDLDLRTRIRTGPLTRGHEAVRHLPDRHRLERADLEGGPTRICR